jgi:hypothetical protein
LKFYQHQQPRISGRATVYSDVLACNPARLIRRQKDHDVDRLLNAADPIERREPGHVVDKFLRPGPKRWRIGRAGRNDIRRDAARADLERQEPVICSTAPVVES